MPPLLPTRANVSNRDAPPGKLRIEIDGPADKVVLYLTPGAMQALERAMSAFRVANLAEAIDNRRTATEPEEVA